MGIVAHLKAASLETRLVKWRPITTYALKSQPKEYAVKEEGPRDYHLLLSVWGEATFLISLNIDKRLIKRTKSDKIDTKEDYYFSQNRWDKPVGHFGSPENCKFKTKEGKSEGQ
jgi:hypothetical protein